jgi:hypothetical protein
MRTVTLVTGPPCAGKTTWVRAHAGPDDLALDRDAIDHPHPEREFRRLADRIAHSTAGTAWVIRSVPRRADREALATRLRADRVVLLLPDLDTLLDRAKHRPNPTREISAVRAWLSRYEPSPLDEVLTCWAVTFRPAMDW